MYLIGGIASGYGGYLLNVCYQPGKDINYFLNRLDQVMAAPFANYWNETSLKAIILGIFVYVIGMVMYVTSRKNYMPGQEFGTAVFADPKKVAKQFADKDEHNNLILSQNVRLSMNTRKTRRNLNVLVIGGSGAGRKGAGASAGIRNGRGHPDGGQSGRKASSGLCQRLLRL